MQRPTSGPTLKLAPAAFAFLTRLALSIPQEDYPDIHNALFDPPRVACEVKCPLIERAAGKGHKVCHLRRGLRQRILSIKMACE